MKQKKKSANVIMIVIIALIVAAGVLGVGYLRGWFGDRGSDAATLADAVGIVNLTRSGVTYPVEQNTPLRQGDVIVCTPGATASVRIAEGSALAIGQQASLTVDDPSGGAFSARLEEGELFAFVTQGAKPVTLSFGGEQISVQESVISLSHRAGVQTLHVYYGSAADMPMGSSATWIDGEKNTGDLTAESLNAFSVAQVRGANALVQTCFTDGELDALEQQRREEKLAQSTEAMSRELSELDMAHECTVTIVCHTILDNWDKLDRAKQEFVPDDGIILATARIPFADGETAFDVTKRACEAYDLQIEYSWTPLYDSYYVEGINNLYEFDCGSESGWMFKVNGWFPNYGSSAYVLADGDSVVWEYTCVGLGADIGGYAG